MKLFLVLALALPLVAQDHKIPPNETDPNMPMLKSIDVKELEMLKSRIAELEKQLAQQGAITNEFATQANTCTANFAVYKVTHPDPQKAPQPPKETPN